MTEHEKNVTNELRKREMMLRQGFLCWMSKPGGTCHDIKAPVATLTSGREQNLCRDIDILCRDQHEIKEQYKKTTTTNQLMLRHNEK